MKIVRILFATPAIIAFAFVQTNAQTPCSPTTAQVDLDINNVRATILNGGDMWRDLNLNNGNEIPKDSGKHALFAGALWIGGIDGSGQLHIAAQSYRQTGNDFWPGPLNIATAQIDSTTCKQFDKIWKIDLQNAIDVVNGTGTPTADMLTYPGNGNVSLGQAQFLAPFYDFNNNGIYEPTLGEVPKFPTAGASNINCCDRLLGDQALWWVFNDAGNIHTETNGDALGIEVQAMAYAYHGIDSILDNTTFYQYKIINRSSNAYSDTYLGIRTNASLGNYTDDYVGCDVMRGLGYVYNGDNFDDGFWGYGSLPPAAGIDFLRGPKADPGDGIDNNLNGIIDEPNEIIQMSGFLAYTNVSPTGNPQSAQGFYNFLRPIWEDFQPVTFGNDGRDPNAPATNFMFPNDTDPNFPGQVWNELTAGNVPGARRIVISAGAFTLQPGAVQCVNFAVVWARTDTISGSFISVPELQAASDHVQAFFDNLCDSTLLTSVAEHEIDFGVIVYPVPASDFVSIEFENKNADDFKLELFSITAEKIFSEENIQEDKLKLITSELSKGVYIYKLTKQFTGKFNSGKLIIN